MQDRIKQQIQDELTKTLEGAYMDALNRGHNVISGNGIEARIKQMAVEAGFPSMAVDNLSDTDLARLVAFARLVAEDCAEICADRFSDGALDIADAIRARYAETKEG